MTNKLVLIVEDDAILAMHLEDTLTRTGYDVLKPVSSGEAALECVRSENPALVLMDIELGKEMNGITAAEEIALISDIPIIFITGFSQDNLLEKAKITAPYGYLVKPVPERELVAAIEMALYKHQIDRQIKMSEIRYHSLVEQATDGIFLLNPAGEILEVNRAGCQMLGQEKNQVIGRNLNDLIFFADPGERIIPPEGGVSEVFQTEQLLKGRDGSLLPVEIRSKFMVGGNTQAMVCDITDRKKAEDMLYLSEEKYRQLFEGMAEAFALHEIVLDDQGKPIDYIFLDINPAFERMTGLKEEDIIGKRIMEIMPGTEPYWIETYGRVALTGEHVLFENYSGSLGRWYRGIAFSPKPGQFATTFFDVTERKKAEESLQESEQRFRQMFAEHDAAMLLVSPVDGRIINANHGAARFYGYTLEELCSMKISQIIQMSQEEIDGGIQDIFSNKANNLIIPNRLANGAVRTVEVYNTPINIDKQSVIFSIIHDVTERIEAEKKSKEQLAELQRWHNATLGREERIMELKREVNRLLKLGGQPLKYPSVEQNE